jgi:hypothetical protein
MFGISVQARVRAGIGGNQTRLILCRIGERSHGADIVTGNIDLVVSKGLERGRRPGLTGLANTQSLSPENCVV